MKQMSLAGGNAFAKKRKTTHKQVFLQEMDQVVPWVELVAPIERYTPKAGPKAGRPAFATETMLHTDFLQQRFTLSDPTMEEVLYDVPLYRQFACLDMSADRPPDESTILHFHHMLEGHGLSACMFDTVGGILATKGLLLKASTAVNATIIAAPNSTNGTGTRDPETHQAKKGGQWHFGIKAHIGVSADSRLVHTMTGTPANIHGVTQTHELLHG